MISHRLKILLIVLDVILSGIISFTSWFVIAQASKIKSAEVPNTEIIKKIPDAGDLPKVEANGQEDADILDDPNRLNILLLGNGGAGHSGGMLTDTIQIISINTSNKKVLMVSIPRDLYIDVAGTGERKINEAYLVGQKSNQAGPVAKETLSKVVGLKIHNFIRIDFSGFVRLIDLIGGVEVEVDEALKDPVVRINVVPGKQHMDGKTALAYVRSRKTTNDFDRSRRQQKVLVAIKNKLLKKDFLLDPGKINNIITTLSKNMNYDIELSEVSRYLKIISDVDLSNITNKVIDNNKKDNLLYSTYNKKGQYILLPTAKNWLKIRSTIRGMLQ